MLTLPNKRTFASGWIASIITTHFTGIGLRLGFLLGLLMSAQASAQTQPADDDSFPPLIPYQHKNFSFRIPEGWTVQVIEDSDDAKLLVVVEDPDDLVNTPALAWFKYPAVDRSVTPQSSVKNLITAMKMENLQIQKEQLNSANYYALLFNFTYKGVYNKGVFYSYFDKQGALVVLHFNSLHDQFDALGGAALPFATFDNVDPSLLKPSGELQTSVEKFPVSFEAVSSDTTTPAPFPPLGLATEVGLRAPLHWTVSVNSLTGEIKLSEDLQNPTSPLVVSKVFTLDELLALDEFTQSFNPTAALSQALATLNIDDVHQREHLLIQGSDHRAFLADVTRAGVPSKVAALYEFDLQQQTFALMAFVAPTARYTDLGGAMLLGVTLMAFDPATYAQATFNSLSSETSISDTMLLTQTLEQKIEEANKLALLTAKQIELIQLEMGTQSLLLNYIINWYDSINKSLESTSNTLSDWDMDYEYTYEYDYNY